MTLDLRVVSAVMLSLPPLDVSLSLYLPLYTCVQLSLGTEDLDLLLEFALDTAQRVKEANLLPVKSKFCNRN